MKNRVNFLIISTAFLFVLSCSDRSGKHYRINEKYTEPGIEIKRLEKDLFETDPARLTDLKDSLNTRYGNFLQLFAWVINAGDLGDSTSYEVIRDFVTDRVNYDVYQKVMEKYPDLSAYEQDMEKAWGRYSYHFPDSLIPGIYSFISGFNNSIIVGDSSLAFGLDRYLGSDSRYYRELGIYNYLTKKMVPGRIVPDAFYAWAKASWPRDKQVINDNLLSNIIYEGKLYYFTKSMLYDMPDSLIFGYTAGQMEFCRNNEYRMWEYLIEHDMLFSKDKMLIRKLTGEAPFTTYFTRESPGRASLWLGFRIVESYMMRNRDVSLPGLMTDDNYKGFLEKARYNPEK